MKRQQLKEIIKEIIDEFQFIDEDGGAMPANATPNIAGFNAPIGAVQRRVQKDSKRRKKVKKQVEK